MNRDREYDFLLHITRRRFLEILEAFARSVGIDEAVVKQIPTLDLTDTKAFSRILAPSVTPKTELRAGCLLHASKEVDDEINSYFESNRKKGYRALIVGMPYATHMRLKLQAEYLFRYIKDIEENLPKLKEDGLLRDELMQAIEQVR